MRVTSGMASVVNYEEIFKLSYQFKPMPVFA
jgi:hypothetical protein